MNNTIKTLNSDICSKGIETEILPVSNEVDSKK
ncbi:hypothetical protein BD780_000804 [Clostridium tetanomorphum]|nr:hypothetical protein [Clostridium tetanomorphum]NRS83579.1 hypothetical protein [Clostridium tetanomorphum]NRZ96780.1 hypothetical protein [Clostridium tetanomorphum]